jgi:large subunit ribosomal protein L32
VAVPKQKQSHSRTGHRRSNHKAAVPALVPVMVDGVEHRVPRRLVAAVERGLVDPTGRKVRRPVEREDG